VQNFKGIQPERQHASELLVGARTSCSVIFEVSLGLMLRIQVLQDVMLCIIRVIDRRHVAGLEKS
jgi:hypothetical protein